MSVLVEQHWCSNQLIAGDVYKLLRPGAGVYTNATQARYANLGTGGRYFRPLLSNSTVEAVRAVGSTPKDWGWRQAAPFDPEPVGYWHGEFIAYPQLSIDAGVSCVATITAVVYINGQEIGRGSVTGQTITVTAEHFPVTVTLTPGFVTTANPTIQVEYHVNVTVGATAVNGYGVVLHVGVDNSNIGGIGFYRRAARTASELVAKPPDTPSRTTAASRRPTEVLPALADLPSRTASVVRLSSEAVTKPTDTPSRQFTSPRTPALQVVAGLVDTAGRQLTSSRPVTEAVAKPADTPSRTTATSRRPTEVLPALADTPSRTSAVARRPTEAVPAPADASSRQLAASRPVTEAVAKPTDAASRSIGLARNATETVNVVLDSVVGRLTYGRNVLHEFVPGTEGPIVNPGRAIRGTVRAANGDVVAGATVELYRQADGVRVRTTTSALDGTYSFPREVTDVAAYYVAAYLEGAPETHDISDRGRIPEPV